MSIYQDLESLYVTHTGCGPSGYIYPSGAVVTCEKCGLAVAGFCGESLELRVGPRRTKARVKEWAEAWLGQTVEVDIKWPM